MNISYIFPICSAVGCSMMPTPPAPPADSEVTPHWERPNQEFNIKEIHESKDAWKNKAKARKDSKY